MNLSGYKKIAENRFIEDKGLYYEDLVPGLIIDHRPGRTITITDNIWTSLISMNQHPIHIDVEHAKNSEFSELLISSLVTFNIINGMTVQTISQKCIANLGWDCVNLLAPVFVGDTLYAQTQILERRLSKTRPNQGIVIVKTIGEKQTGVPVIEFKRTFMALCRTENL